MELILFLLLFKIDNDHVLTDTFDMIEVNHSVNEWGVERWCQIIFWDWHELDNKYHVEKWIMMKDAYQMTEEGAKKWETARREFEQKLTSIPQRRQWLQHSDYKGDFVGGMFYPEKDWKTGYYVVEFTEGLLRRKIKAKIFRETYTQFDPEHEDRPEHSERRGLKKDNKNNIEQILETLR